MFIPVILGTAREGRRSENPAKYMVEEVKSFGAESELVDVRDYLIGRTDASGETPQAKKFIEILKRSDALIIVVPEYNHGYPGELKIMLDMAYNEYAGKPIGICGVSVGPFGGMRVVEQLRQVVIEYSMIPIREAVYFGNVGKLFDDSGTITDASYHERAQKFIANLKSSLK